MDYITVIEPVLEITLLGSAGDKHWRTLLSEEGLPILSQQGQARILISAVDSKYMGFPFRELSVSVQVDEQRFFLAQAYNSLAAFAWVERVFFRTPYYHGKVTAQPRHIGLHVGTQQVFTAALAESRPALEQHECNELQIYLPKRLHPRSKQHHFFHARLEGDTQIYREGFEVRGIQPLAHQPVWGLLQASDFRVDEWRVRTAARHSKSKTFQASPA